MKFFLLWILLSGKIQPIDYIFKEPIYFKNTIIRHPAESNQLIKIRIKIGLTKTINNDNEDYWNNDIFSANIRLRYVANYKYKIFINQQIPNLKFNKNTYSTTVGVNVYFLLLNFRK